MKLKRSIRMLMCCMAVAGMLAVNGLTAEAAAPCKHTFMQSAMNVFKEQGHNLTHHWSICGTQFKCPCGYEYWEDLYECNREVHTIKTIDGVRQCTGCDFKY